jgi:phosphatidylserine/phosphatidylglycerophosphate/cardiolipin synthase-like enzyme
MAATSDVVRKWRDLLGPMPLIRYGNKVTTLVDGAESFEAIYRALITAREANHYIYLLGWYCDASLSLIAGDARTSLSAIFKAAPQVQVRVMLWAQPPLQKSIKINRATVDLVNPLKNGAAILDGNLPSIVNSHHQKVILVNGSRGLVGFCGGIDLNSDRIRPGDSPEANAVNGQNGTPLHDVHCQIEGPGCMDLLDVFAQRWRSHPDSKQIDQARGKLIGKSGDSPNQKGMAWVRVTRTFNCVTPSEIVLPVAPGKSIGVPPIGLMRRPSCKKERTIAEILLASIAAAEKIIYVEDQYMIDLVVAKALNQALSKVKHIIFLIPHSSISDLPGVWKRRKAFIQTVQGTQKKPKADGGGKDRGTFQAYYLVDAATGKIGSECYVHAKTWIFDDEMVIIGSANCNRRGLSSDSEANVCVFDSPFKSTNPSIASALRMRLWASHLGVSKGTDLSNPVNSAALWNKVTKTSRVRPYKPDEAQDSPNPIADWLPKDVDLSADGVVDPDYDDLPPCAQGSC